MEEPVVFNNRNGEKLFGIVHVPEPSHPGEKRIGVNLLNPGIKYRVAPNRLNVKLAKQLCQKGYYVLRFDPSGIGDSEGELPENVLIPDIWERIQTGLFVQDTIDANDFFINHYRLNKLILVGNCGGAITSLLTSSKDSRIEGLCLIDIPVNLRTSNMSFADKVAEGGEKVDHFFSAYMVKLLNPTSWYRFFTFKTNYKALWKILSMKFRKHINLSYGDNRLPKNLESLCHERKLNRLFFESFGKFVSRNKHILFVLAGNDLGTEIFQHYFQNDYLKRWKQNERFDELVEIFMVENANHIYTLSEWQESLINKVSSWMTKVNQPEWTEIWHG